MNTRILLLLSLIFAIPGCGEPSSMPADADKSRGALQAALEAWQKGEPQDSLQSRTPAIHVNDPEWRMGRKLSKFEIKSGAAFGNSWRGEVLLTMDGDDKNAAGDVVARYTVDTDPALVVIREEEEP